MKKLLLPALFAASTVFGVAGRSEASTCTVNPVFPYTTSCVQSNPPAQPPVLTVPPAQSPLPVTGSDSSSTIAIAAVAVGVGGGLMLVARSRRRHPAQPTV